MSDDSPDGAPETGFDRHSRSVLTHRDRPRFPSESLFDRIGRAVCDAACLPRKELYESWEVARRARRRMRGGRVVDLAGGHGLTARIALLLDATSGAAVVVDRRIPSSAAKLGAALDATWPRLVGRVALHEGAIDDTELASTDLVFAVHACGALTDRVIDRVVAARARLAALPCCHEAATCDAGGLDAWMELGLAIDSTRALRLRAAGYEVKLESISPAITPKNRLLLAVPRRLD